MARDRLCARCGCTDSAACVTKNRAGEPETCHWVWVDSAAGVGFCSRCVPVGRLISPELKNLARTLRRRLDELEQLQRKIQALKSGVKRA